ncbi:glycosyltransferase [Patescibacteria group bacterium]|nr:glycosyltransferase [Patescibacteria group bacterium]
MKVALVYDRINKFGGAERLLLALHEIWPEAPLYTSVYDKRLTPWADSFDVRTSFLQKLPLPKNAHEMYPYLMGLAFESFNFDKYDLVISVTHEFAKAIITKPETFHLCYCLNPVGYLWDSHDDYFSAKPGWFRAVSNPLVKYLRWYDRIVAARPDQYLTISRAVQERIKRIYNRESEVIYPPVEIPNPKSQIPSKSQASNAGEYYLIVSRLAPQKRLDIAVSAFNQLGLPLKIIGTGKEENRLKGRAKKNIEFLGYLTDEELNRYYENCRAVVIPGEEDFNIVAVEAQAHGKPVIAYKKGGVTETVVEGKTGWFFDEPKPESLAAKIREIREVRVIREDCNTNAQRFSKERFKKEFKETAERKYREYVRHS